MLTLAKKSPMTIVNNAAKAAEGLRQGFLSRRDSTIVARHEVLGIMKKIARPRGTTDKYLRD
jgi:hypothetical protein